MTPIPDRLQLTDELSALMAKELTAIPEKLEPKNKV